MSLARACKFLGWSRQAYYQQIKAEAALHERDAKVVELVQEVRRRRCQEFCVLRSVKKSQYSAFVNRSPNRMANWLAACFHVMGGIFQSFSILRKAR